MEKTRIELTLNKYTIMFILRTRELPHKTLAHFNDDYSYNLIATILTRAERGKHVQEVHRIHCTCFSARMGSAATLYWR
ncbi:hypothetical protein EMIT0P258_30464 [Pseudomonas sp. IT-P258]